MKKFYIIALVAIIATVMVSGCTTEPTPTNNHTNNHTGNHTLILVSDGTEISYEECAARGVNDKVIVLHTSGCPACGIAVPILEELSEEIDYEFEFIELSTNVERAYEIGILPTHVPTALIKCKAYTGAKTKEEYKNLIGV